jgi:hypothetical protein
MGRPGSSGWGWYQRAERAKFRRVVVDAKGQRGIWFVDGEWERRGEQTRREGKHVHGNNNDNLRRRAAMH